MYKENKITINNLIYALLFLVFGMILLTDTDNLISIASKVIGTILVIVGIVKTIIYVYMKGKLGEYSTSKLIIGISLICLGTLFILLSGTLDFMIRTVIGLWVLFAGINKIIFSISIKSFDKKGFLVYLITALLMTALGVLLISGILDKMIGLLIIIYSVMEIINYIYYKVKDKDYDEVNEPDKKTKKIKKLKNNKVVDAVIEEEMDKK